MHHREAWELPVRWGSEGLMIGLGLVLGDFKKNSR